MGAVQKVFCIGFQKTGTTSLYAALKMLGYRVSGPVGMDWTAERLARDGAALCLGTAETVDAVEDMPWPIYFRELDAAFPGARFILTERDSAAWFASAERHFGNRPSEMNAFVYGRDNASPAGAAAHWINIKEAHERAVRAHFAARPDDLLTMNLAAGDGWNKLAPFLGRPAPDSPFPQINRSEDRKRWSYRASRKLLKLLGRTPMPERLASR